MLTGEWKNDFGQRSEKSGGGKRAVVKSHCYSLKESGYQRVAMGGGLGNGGTGTDRKKTGS